MYTHAEEYTEWQVLNPLELGIMSCLILVIGTKLWSFTTASSVHKC